MSSKRKDNRIATQKGEPCVNPPERPKHQKPNEPQVLRLTDRFERAVEYATHVHAGQRRKQTSVPYLAHLLGVASIVLEDRGDEDKAIAALLHDAPEDQGGQERLDDITSRFGDRVGTIVEGCTDTFEKIKPKWLPRKQKYIAQLREKRSQSVLRVSGADKLHNLRAIAADFYSDGAHVFCRFKGGREGTLWYHACLLNVYREHAGDGRLSRALHQQIEVAFTTLQQSADPAFRWPRSESELPAGWPLDYDLGEAGCTCGQALLGV